MSYELRRNHRQKDEGAHFLRRAPTSDRECDRTEQDA